MNTFETLSNSIINTLVSNLSCYGDYSFEVIESEYTKDIYVYKKDCYMNVRLQINHIIPSSMMINQTHSIQISIEGEECWIPIISEYILKDEVGLEEKVLCAIGKYFKREVESTHEKLQLLQVLCN